MNTYETTSRGALSDSPGERALFSKIRRRLMPMIMLGFLISYVDRANVGFAKFQMLEDLHLSEATYGLGATMFLLAYSLFGVPSNWALKKIGANRWIASVMIVWGVISASTAWVHSAHEFYVVRFLLGAAEAGYVPGAVYYLSCWFPKAYRGRATATFISGSVVAGIVAGPLSGFILHVTDGAMAFAAWQWLFILEAIPALILAVFIWARLTPRPEDASWLSAIERQLHSRLMDEPLAVASEEFSSPRSVLTNVRTWLLGILYGANLVCFYGAVFWLPTMIKSAGAADPLLIGQLSAIPWAVALVVMLAVAAYVDRHQNTIKVLFIIGLVGAVDWAASPFLAFSTFSSMLVIVIAVAGLMAMAPIFWNLPMLAFPGGGVLLALSVGAISSIGNFISLVSPYAIGVIKETTNSMTSVMYVFSVMNIISSLLCLAFYRLIRKGL